MRALPQAHLPASSPPVRLDFFEEVFCRSYLASGDEIGAIVIHLSGPLDEAALRQAVDHLQICHPRLRSRISVCASWMEWIVSPPDEALPIPVEYAYDTADSLPWEARCQRMFQEGLDFIQGQVGRICVLRNLHTQQSELIFVSHHHVLSGGPGISLFHELLVNYENLLQDPEWPPPAPQSLVHSSDTRLRVPLKSYFSFLPWYIRKLCQIRQEIHPLPLAPDPTPDPSLWARHVFSETETIALVRRCRSNRTTLLGLLLAGSLWALHRTLGRWDVCFQCTAPLDLHRSFVSAEGKIQPQEHGSFVGRYTANRGMKASDRFWDVARQFSRESNTEWKSGCTAIMHRLLTNPSTRFVGLPWFPKSDPRKNHHTGRRKATLNVSNTGIAPFKVRYGPLTVESVGIAIQQRIRGSNLRINCMVVCNRLNLNLIPWQGVDPAFVHTVRGELIRLLVDLATDADYEPQPGGSASAHRNARSETRSVPLASPAP